MKALTTARLYLEPLEPRHAELMFRGLSDLDLYEFLDHGPPRDVDDLRVRYERWAGRVSPDGRRTWLSWALSLRDTPDSVGYVQATVEGGGAEIAYVLFRDFRGQGLAREAGRPWVAICAPKWMSRNSGREPRLGTCGLGGCLGPCSSNESKWLARTRTTSSTDAS
jgi:RimJ/RimL family protein N-acetyltransferase